MVTSAASDEDMGAAGGVPDRLQACQLRSRVGLAILSLLCALGCSYVGLRTRWPTTRSTLDRVRHGQCARLMLDGGWNGEGRRWL